MSKRNGKNNATTRFQKWKSLVKDNKNGYNIEDKGSPQQPFVSSPKGDESTRGTSFFSIWKKEKSHFTNDTTSVSKGSDSLKMSSSLDSDNKVTWGAKTSSSNNRSINISKGKARKIANSLWDEDILLNIIYMWECNG